MSTGKPPRAARYAGQALKVEHLNPVLHVTTFPYVSAKGPTIRSCWNCNPAHEHLKESKWLVCFSCGREYRFGVETGT